MLKNYLGFLVQRNNLGSIVGRKNTFLPCRKICRARTDRHHLFVKGDLWHFVPAGIIWQRSEWFDTFKPYRIWEELFKPFCKNLTRLGPSGPPDWSASPVQWRPPAQSKMQLVRSVVDCIYSWAARRVTSWHCYCFCYKLLLLLLLFSQWWTAFIVEQCAELQVGTVSLGFPLGIWGACVQK